MYISKSFYSCDIYYPKIISAFNTIDFLTYFIYSLFTILLFITNIFQVVSYKIKHLLYKQDNNSHKNNSNTKEQESIINDQMDIVYIRTYKCLPEYFVFNTTDHFYLAACFSDYLNFKTNNSTNPDIHCVNGKRWFILVMATAQESQPSPKRPYIGPVRPFFFGLC